MTLLRQYFGAAFTTAETAIILCVFAGLMADLVLAAGLLMGSMR